MRRVRPTAALILSLLFACIAAAQNAPCKFDPSKLMFAGTPVEQARCLLRPNAIGGVLGKEPKRLPNPLENLIGKKVTVSRDAFAAFLRSRAIDPETIGGPIDRSLSKAKTPRGESVDALYFVIHDTSYPYLGDGEFPAGYDSDSKWKGNDLSIWKNQPVAHIFVNRLGESLTATPFEEPVRKGFGTKFARDVLKAEAKGLQIHIELIQPRRRDPADANPKNDRIAPSPGFTPAQYERLALLYIAASVRRGSWLVPGYHSAFDAGIKDAHDDPQNFDLDLFAKTLDLLVKMLK